MQHSIVQKLDALLVSPITRESEAVYLLCEVRKLLDLERTREAFPLRLHCNWALHVDLTHTRTTLPFLKQVDSALASLIGPGKSDLSAEEKVFDEFVSLKALRGHLRAFLQRHRLPARLCDDDGWWHQFLTHHAGVIDDGSLSCSADTNGELAYLKKVTFTKGDTLHAGAHVPFAMTWRVDLLDGRSVTMSGTLVKPTGGRWLRTFGVSLDGT